MSANIIGKVRAMFNDNGRTPEEAATFHAKASEWCRKYNLGHIFAEEMRAKPKTAKKGKAKAKPESNKPVDNRMRSVLVKNVMTGRWVHHTYSSKADLKTTLTGLRAAGYVVKSKVL